MKKIYLFLLISFLFLFTWVNPVEGGFYTNGGYVETLSGIEISLHPGRNVLSTPAQISGIYYHWGSCGNERRHCINSPITDEETEYLEFFIMSGGKWIGIKPTPETIKPLEGILVKSYFNDGYEITFAYDENYSGSNISKNLSNGRNFLGITNIYNPLSNIINVNVEKLVDLTLIPNYTGNGNGNRTNEYAGGIVEIFGNGIGYTGYELGEAYGVYINGNNGIYTGFNRKQNTTITKYQECVIVCQDNQNCKNDCRNTYDEIEDKIIFVPDETFELNYDGMVDGISRKVPLISGYLFVDTTKKVHITPFVDIVVKSGLANTSIAALNNGDIRINIDGQYSPYYGQFYDTSPNLVLDDNGSYTGKLRFGKYRDGFVEGLDISGGYHSFMIYIDIENITGFIDGTTIKLGDINENSFSNAYVDYGKKGVIFSGILPSATITMKNKSNILGLNILDENGYNNYAIERFGIDEDLPIWELSVNKDMLLKYRIRYFWIDKYNRYNYNGACRLVDPIIVINPNQPVNFKYYVNNSFYSGFDVNNSWPVSLYSGDICYPVWWNTFTMPVNKNGNTYIAGYGTVDLPIGTELKPTFIVYNIYDGDIEYYYEQGKEYIVTGGKYTIVNNYGMPINIDNFVFTGINNVYSGDTITLFEGPIYSLSGNAILQNFDITGSGILEIGEKIIFNLYINDNLIDTKTYTGNSLSFNIDNLNISREINNFKISATSYINNSGTFSLYLKGYGTKGGEYAESNIVSSIIETKRQGDINNWNTDSGNINFIFISNYQGILVNPNIGGFNMISDNENVILKYIELSGLSGQSLIGLNLEAQEMSGGFVVSSGVIPFIKSGDLRLLENSNYLLSKGKRYNFRIKGSFNVNTATGIKDHFSTIMTKIIFENNSGHQYITGNILLANNIGAVGAYPLLQSRDVWYETGDNFVRYKIKFERLQFPLKSASYETITINKLYLSGSHNLLSNPNLLYEATNTGVVSQGVIPSGILRSGARNDNIIEIDADTLMHYNGYVVMTFTLTGINWETANSDTPFIALQLYDMDYTENFADGTSFFHDHFYEEYDYYYNRDSSLLEITN